MANTNGKEFNNNKFYNTKISGSNTWNVFGDVANPSQQTEGNNKDITKATLNAYTKLYEDLVSLHKKNYLDVIKSNEESHYKSLTGRYGFIYKQYNDLYERLEKRHAEYLNKINGGQSGTNTNVAGWVGVSGKEDSTTTTNQLAGAGESGKTNSNESIFADISRQLSTISSNAQTSANNTYAIGTYLHKTDKENSKYSKELKDAIEKGIKDSKTPTSRDKDRDNEGKKQSASLKEVNEQVIDVVNITQRQLVQGKYMNRLVDDVLDVVKVFQKQESVADSVVSLIMIALNAVLGWLGDGISDVHNTQEETYKTFGLYIGRENSQYRQNAVYNEYMKGKIDLLSDLGMKDNIKSTEWWKAEAGLLEKGFSATQAEGASLNNTILNKIAPALDTNNQYFLDLEQQGLYQMTKSLGGIVESVRDTAGSSRVTMGSLGTIIDKLVPVELYTKRELMDDTARAMLSALENSGLATADAINLVSDSIEAYSSPYKALTGGNVLQRVALSQTGGVANDPWSLIQSQLGLATMFTSGTTSPLTQGAVNSVLGAGWLNDWADYDQIYSDFLEALASAEAKEGAKSPEEAYHDLVLALGNNILQTGEQRLEILATNSKTVNDINGTLQMIASGIATIVDDFIPTVSGWFEDIHTGLMKWFNVEGYVEENLEKAKNEESKGMKQYYAEEAEKYGKRETAKDLLLAPLKMLSSDYDFDDAVKELNTDFKNIDTSYELQGKKKKSKWETAYKSSPMSYAVGTVVGKPLEAVGIDVPWLGTGGYLAKPELVVAGDNPYGEIISPIPQLSSAVMRGVNLANKNNKPDTTDVEAVIREVGVAIVKAIAENGGSIFIDSSSGLMSGNISTSLKPIMSGKGGH